MVVYIVPAPTRAAFTNHIIASPSGAALSDLYLPFSAQPHRGRV